MGLLALVVTALLGGGWLGVLVARGSAGTSYRGWVAWLIIPIAGAAVLAIFLTSQSAMNPLFRLRFLLSRPALHGVATAPSDRPVSPPGWIGLFQVQRIDRFGAAVHFITVSCGVVDECGIAYVPGPPPPRRTKTRLKSLGDGWYHLYSVF